MRAKQNNKPRKAKEINSYTVGCIAGACAIFLVGVCVVLGFVVGAGLGNKLNKQGRDLSGSPVLFDERSPPEEMPLFWVVQYELLNPDASPRLIEITDPDIQNPDWFFGPPETKTRITQGPWEPAVPWESEQSGLTYHPLGKLQIHAGGVRFQKSQAEKTHVELILYPAETQGEWVRWFYTYEVDQGVVVPKLIRRERQSSDWGLDFIVYSGFAGAIVGLLVGFALSIVIGILLVKTRRSRRLLRV